MVTGFICITSSQFKSTLKKILKKYQISNIKFLKNCGYRFDTLPKYQIFIFKKILDDLRVFHEKDIMEKNENFTKGEVIEQIKYF